MLEWRNKCSSGLVCLKVSGICANPAASNARSINVWPLIKNQWNHCQYPTFYGRYLFELEQKSYLVTVCHFSDWMKLIPCQIHSQLQLLMLPKLILLDMGFLEYVIRITGHSSLVRRTRGLPHHIISKIQDHLLIISREIVEQKRQWKL